MALGAIPADIAVATSDAKPHAAKKLDERELQVRNQAFFRSYQIIAALTALGLRYTQFAVGVVWGFLLLSITLSHAFIAWPNPDYEIQSPANPNDGRSGFPYQSPTNFSTTTITTATPIK